MQLLPATVLREQVVAPSLVTNTGMAQSGKRRGQQFT